MSKEEEQKTAAELRERYLKAINFLYGKPVEVQLYDRVKVSGTFEAMQRDGEHFIVSKMKTPTAAVVDHAVLRSRDTVSMSTTISE
ncbi:hypothetical protein M3Y99_00060700 [Aphelenchoides fujianensis]|nr:hypothetical protein M3Y99_00060700 [Aphelenchoides fujianensis]